MPYESAAASNSACLAVGNPYQCCQGAGVGTCLDLSGASVTTPSNSQCTSANTPNTCCTGLHTGTCDWVLIDTANCSANFHQAVYGKFVEAGESGTTNYNWNFVNTGDSNAQCTGSGAPFACCTGGDAGTCANFNCTGAGIAGPANNPAPCCTGAGTGTCQNMVVGVVGITLFSNVGGAPTAGVGGAVENEGNSCNSASISVSAPSLTTTQDRTLNVLSFGIAQDNSLTRPSGYSLSWEHSISGTGPDTAIDSLLIANSKCTTATHPFSCCTGLGMGTCSSAITGTQDSTASTAADNVGFQLNLEPLP